MGVSCVKKKGSPPGCLAAVSTHIGEPFHCLGEVFDGLVRVSVLNAVPDTVLDMPFQNHLAAPVQGGLGR